MRTYRAAAPVVLCLSAFAASADAQVLCRPGSPRPAPYLNESLACRTLPGTSLPPQPKPPEPPPRAPASRELIRSLPWALESTSLPVRSVILPGGGTALGSRRLLMR